jgi:hypothetical protein
MKMKISFGISSSPLVGVSHSATRYIAHGVELIDNLNMISRILFNTPTTVICFSFPFLSFFYIEQLKGDMLNAVN